MNWFFHSLLLAVENPSGHEMYTQPPASVVPDEEKEEEGKRIVEEDESARET